MNGFLQQAKEHQGATIFLELIYFFTLKKKKASYLVSVLVFLSVVRIASAASSNDPKMS